MDRKNNFDFMRLVAATLVVYSHSFPLLGYYGQEPFARWSGYFTGGALGVAIFFAMSGYLVTASQQNSANVLEFLSKRALRIFPGLAVVVLLCAFVLGPLLTTMPLSEYLRHGATRDYLWNIALWVHYPLPGMFANLPHAGSINGSLWTLPIEAAMYAAVALLGVAGLLKRQWIPFVLVALVALYAYLSFDKSLQNLPVWRIGPLKECTKFGIYFFAGSALYLFDRIVPWRAWIAALLLIAWIATFKTPAGIYCMFVAVPYCTLYIARANVQPLANFGRYGDFSYGLYIYAFPIQQTLVYLLGKQNISPVQLFFAAQVLALGCAFLSWHFVEKPALQLKHRLPFARRSTASGATAGR
jgi:peptidoglycan/LPS O-acetylase OafA/YrhL